MPKAQQNAGQAIVLADATDYPMVQMDAADLREAIQTNLNGETLNFKDLRRVKVPAGGAVSWSVPAADGGKPIPTNNFEGVIIHTELQRVMWLRNLDGPKTTAAGGNKAPDCKGKPDASGVWHGSKSRQWIASAAKTFLENGNAAEPVDTGPRQTCADCPFGQFGSGKNGRGQKCQQKGIHFIATEDSLLPIVLIAPVMSLDNRKKYLLNLAMNPAVGPEGGKAKSRGYYEVLTDFSLEADSNGENDFARIVFTRKAILPEEQRTAFAEYRKTMRPLVASLVDQAAAAPVYDQPIETDGDDFGEIAYVAANDDEDGPTDED